METNEIELECKGYYRDYTFFITIEKSTFVLRDYDLDYINQSIDFRKLVEDYSAMIDRKLIEYNE